MVRASFDLLGLQTFFTGGPTEVRSWTIPIGATAKESAGVIHSDFERGFIKAEVFGYNDLVKYGSENALYDLGLARTEGKEYIVVKVPNVIDISYGRGVGYSFTEHDLGEEIHKISATKIRKEMRIKGKLK